MPRAPGRAPQGDEPPTQKQALDLRTPARPIHNALRDPRPACPGAQSNGPEARRGRTDGHGRHRPIHARACRSGLTVAGPPLRWFPQSRASRMARTGPGRLLDELRIGAGLLRATSPGQKTVRPRRILTARDRASARAALAGPAPASPSSSLARGHAPACAVILHAIHRGHPFRTWRIRLDRRTLTS